MRITEHTSKGPVAKSGFAVLADLLHGRGSGAPSRAPRLALIPAAALLALLVVFAAATALAASPPQLAPATSGIKADGEVILRGAVNPEGSEVTDCHFAYGLSTAYGATAPCSPAPGSGAEPSEVEATIANLQAGATYHYTLLATSAAGAEELPDATFLTPAAESASSCPNEARRVEQHATFLSDCRAFELVSPPDKNGGEVLRTNQRTRVAADGNAFGFASLSGFADTEELGVGTDYLSERSTNPEPGDNGWSTHPLVPTQPTFTFEATQTGEEPLYTGRYSSDDKKGVLYASGPLTENAATEKVPNLYLRSDLRSPGSGNYQLLTACPRCEESGGEPLSPGRGIGRTFSRPGFVAASPDFDHVLFESVRNLTAEAPPQPGPCSLDDSFIFSLSCAGRLYESEAGTLRLAGMIPETVQSLRVGATSGTFALSFKGEESGAIPFDATASELRSALDSLASIGPGNVSVAGGPGDASGSNPYLITFQGSLGGLGVPLLSADPTGLVGGSQTAEVALSPRTYRCGAGQNACVAADGSIAGEGGRNNVLTPGVISDGSDGHSRVFFTQPVNEAGETALQASELFPIILANNSLSGNLFVRTDHQTTEQLNVSERAEPESPAPAAFLDASVDGTRAFFESNADLTEDAEGGERKIYMWSATPDGAGHHLTLIDRDEEPGDGIGTFEGLIGISDDGHYAYFLHQGELVKNSPLSGRWIDLWHDGKLTRVAPSPQGGAQNELLATGFIWVVRPPQAKVSPDGRTLFLSTVSGAGLVGYDHGSCDTGLGFGCRELYLYSATTGQVACVSCIPSSGSAEGESSDPTRMATVQIGENITGGTKSDPPNWLPLSQDGDRAFFSTPEALLPEDTNGVFDAYEYDARAGQVHLLSSGTSPDDSYFLNADAEGRNVFVATDQRLVGWDRDQSYDVYDVRAGGGFPEPIPVPAPCNGESCHRAVPASPAQPSIGSGLEGPGNPKHPARKAKHRKRHHRKHRHRAHKRAAGANRGAGR